MNLSFLGVKSLISSLRSAFSSALSCQCLAAVTHFFSFLQLEKLIEKNYYLHKSAQEAYKSYVRAYDSHSLKQIYNVSTLNLLMVALSFGFKVPPYVDLSILYSRLTLLEKLKGKLVLLVDNESELWIRSLP